MELIAHLKQLFSQGAVRVHPAARRPTLMTGMLCYVFATAVACVSVSSKWEEAQRTNTVGAYDAFIRDFPQTKYAAQAQEKVEAIREAESRRLSEARRLSDESAFAMATKEGTPSAYESYISRYPGGVHFAEAKRALAEVLLSDARSSKRLTALKKFLANGEGHPAEEEARRAISEIEKRVRSQNPALGVPLTNGDVTVTVRGTITKWSSSGALRGAAATSS